MWWVLGLAPLSVALAVIEHGWTTVPRTRLAEGAADAADRQRLQALLAEGDRVEDALIALRVATQVALAVLLVSVFHQLLGGPPGRLLPLALAGVAAFAWITIFCRVLPSELSAARLESIVRATLPTLVVAARALSPPVAGMRRILRLATGHTREAQAELNADEILSTVEEGEREGHLQGQQAEIIERVLELKHTEVRQFMTPRTDMDVIDAGATVKQARDEVLASGRSRYPLVEGTVDRVVGILHVKDLVGRPSDMRVTELARPPRFVPESKYGAELLAEFRSQRTHLAVVLDEYGGTAGLVTIEDVLEEIVGEIDDEFDDEVEPDELRVVDSQHAVAPGGMHVDELNRALSINLPESDDWATLGGFVFHTLGRLPEQGEELQHENVTLRIEQVIDRRVARVAIAIGERVG